MHWEGCVGCAEAVTCHVPSKTTGKKMVQPLLCLCPSHMPMNNKNRALKNKTHCFKKPSGEYLQQYHLFFSCFFLILFLLLKLTSFPLAEPAFPDSTPSSQIFHPALEWISTLGACAYFEKRLMPTSENYLQDVQNSTTSEEKPLRLEKFRHYPVSSPQNWASSSLLDYSWDGDPPSYVYCPTDLSLGKKQPSMQNTGFHDTVCPLSNALGTS